MTPTQRTLKWLLAHRQGTRFATRDCPIYQRSKGACAGAFYRLEALEVLTIHAQEGPRFIWRLADKRTLQRVLQATRPCYGTGRRGPDHLPRST